MGFYDREYYRSEPARGWDGQGLTPACKWIIGICVAVYVAQVLTFPQPGMTSRGAGVTEWVDFSFNAVLRGQVWRLVTYAFAHDPNSLLHIIFNMLILWSFGPTVEQMYGTREFIRFYLAAAVASSLAHVPLGLLINDSTPLIGASGAVLAMLMVYSRYYPRHKILLLFVLPVELRFLIWACVIFDLYPVLQALAGRASMSHVAHAAHLGGLLYGYLYHKFDLRFSHWRWVERLWGLRGLPKLGAPAERRPQVRVYRPPLDEAPAQHFNQRVDEILAKISASGEASLTDDEREVLKEASRRYKRP